MMLTQLKSQVKLCLKNEPSTRNSDITLTIRIWQQFHDINSSIQLSQLYDLPRQSSIKRIRAEFQNKLGMFLPSVWTVARQRRINRNIDEQF